MTTVLYVPPGTFKNSTSIPDGLGDEDVERALAAASGAVEEICKRRFWLDPEPVTRTYTATSRRMVVVDDVATITSVTSAGTAITGYVAEPQNADLDGKPFKWLMSDNVALSCERAAIAVTGRFGWPQVPDQVEQFVTIIAAKLLKRTREAPFGLVQAGGLDGQAARLAREDPDTMLLIQPLKRRHPVVA
jgi:hypothetical protein